MTFIGRSRFARSTFALPVLILLLLISGRAQELTRVQKVGIADCALHGGGGWVDGNLYDKGRAKFSYLSEPDLDMSDQKDPRNIYVAFWNATHNAGELLVFHFFKNSCGKDFFILNNQGHIVNNNGHLEVRDALWGVYTHQKLQGLLPALKRKAVTIVAVNHVSAGSSICKTPFDLDHIREWEW